MIRNPVQIQIRITFRVEMRAGFVPGDHTTEKFIVRLISSKGSFKKHLPSFRLF